MRQLKLPIAEGKTLDMMLVEASTDANKRAAVGAARCARCELVHVVIEPRQVVKEVSVGVFRSSHDDLTGVCCGVELTANEAIEFALQLFAAAGSTVERIAMPARLGPGRIH